MVPCPFIDLHVEAARADISPSRWKTDVFDHNFQLFAFVQASALYLLPIINSSTRGPYSRKYSSVSAKAAPVIAVVDGFRYSRKTCLTLGTKHLLLLASNSICQ